MSLSDSLKFFQDHGIYYKEDPNIALMVETLGNAALAPDGMTKFQSRLEDEVRSTPILICASSDNYSGY